MGEQVRALKGELRPGREGGTQAGGSAHVVLAIQAGVHVEQILNGRVWRGAHEACGADRVGNSKPLRRHCARREVLPHTILNLDEREVHIAVCGGLVNGIDLVKNSSPLAARVGGERIKPPRRVLIVCALECANGAVFEDNVAGCDDAEQRGGHGGQSVGRAVDVP